jgi:hypothetical protein
VQGAEMNQRGVAEQTCCALRHELAEECATTARLYSEAIALLTQSPLRISESDHIHLRVRALEAQKRSEEMFVAFEEHLDQHRCHLATDPPDQWASGKEALTATA